MKYAKIWFCQVRLNTQLQDCTRTKSNLALENFVNAYILFPNARFTAKFFETLSIKVIDNKYMMYLSIFCTCCSFKYHKSNYLNSVCVFLSLNQTRKVFLHGIMSVSVIRIIRTLIRWSCLLPVFHPEIMELVK